eukprot:576784-Rhodomonas_salina.5
MEKRNVRLPKPTNGRRSPGVQGSEVVEMVGRRVVSLISQCAVQVSSSLSVWLLSCNISASHEVEI